MYINYQPTPSGITYATATRSIRFGRQVKKSQAESIYLGRVLDKDRQIFKNKIDGIFQFDLKTGAKNPPPADFVPNIRRKNAKAPELLLNFGDAYFVDQIIKKTHFSSLFDAIGYGNPDSVKALALFYMLSKKSNRHAENWYEGSFARILYPKANLTSQRISDMLSSIGAESTYQQFFNSYIPYVSKVSKEWGFEVGEEEVNKKDDSGVNHNNSKDNKEKDVIIKDGHGILIDSTGLPNSVHFPLTAISNHNGVISEEVRLIYVTQRGTGLPLYMRYVPGNIIDATTLVTTMHELKAMGIDTKFAIMDAGYVTDANLRTLKKNKVSFLARLPENRSVFKGLLSENRATLMDENNLIRYKERFVYIKRFKRDVIEGMPAYLYLGMDVTMRSILMKQVAKKANISNLSDDEIRAATRDLGIFCLVSSRPIATESILSLYYTRQDIEQVFDLEKNYGSLLPLCIQTEETFRGHLLMTFLATVVMRQIQQMGKKINLDLEEIFERLINQKCKAFPDVVIPQEATKKQKEVYSAFRLRVPQTIVPSR